MMHFFRGNANPAHPLWKVRAIWYTEGGGVHVPDAPICEWTGTGESIDQFARIDNYRGKICDDLNNHTYAIIFDHCLKIRDDRTLGGQVGTE